MDRYRFALRPRWVLSHLLVAALALTTVNLGLWQVRRLEERRTFNSLVQARTAEPLAELDELLASEAGFDDAEAVAYRRVTVEGTYETEHEVLVRGRSLHGRPGAWVLTPLVSDNGAVIVNRGWLPAQGVLERVPADAKPRTTHVTVSGLLLPTQTRGRFGPTDPERARLTSLARVDLARYQQQLPFDLYPAYVQLATQRPTQNGAFPTRLPEPQLSDGPHLNYAVQWFIFTTIAVVGYPLILRRQARRAQPRRDRTVA